MKAKKLKKYGQISLDLLLAISEIALDLAVTFDPRKFSKSIPDKKNRVNDYFRILNRSGYVDFKHVEGRTYSVRLTQKGKIKLLENSEDGSTDGKWRLLSFDIPEDKRRQRDQFRRTIKRIGFKQVQKSLWACPFVKANGVKLAIEEYDLSRYIAYMIVEETDIEDYLKKLFSDELKAES
jgi:CRISPR-associated endonuclease Cas2